MQNKKVLRFDDFIKGEAGQVRKQVFRQVEAAMWPGLFVGNYLTEAEKVWLKAYLVGRKVSNVSESLMDIIRDGVDKMKNSDIGKAVAQKLGSLVDNGMKFASYLADLILRAWDKILAFFMKKFEAPKKALINDIKTGKFKGKLIKQNLNKDIHDLGDTTKFWLTTMPNKIAASVKDFYTKDLVREALSNSADIIKLISEFNPASVNEGLFSFLDSITQQIAKVPPFSALTKIKDVAADKTNAMLVKFSEMTKAAGGPGVYTFAAISAIVAFFVEYFVKTASVSAVDDILASETVLRFLPLARTIIITIEVVALCVAIIETTKEIGELEFGLENA